MEGESQVASKQHRLRLEKEMADKGQRRKADMRQRNGVGRLGSILDEARFRRDLSEVLCFPFIGWTRRPTEGRSSLLRSDAFRGKTFRDGKIDISFCFIIHSK